MLFVVRWLYWKFVSIKGLAVKWSMARGRWGSGWYGASNATKPDMSAVMWHIKSLKVLLQRQRQTMPGQLARASPGLPPLPPTCSRVYCQMVIILLIDFATAPTWRWLINMSVAVTQQSCSPLTPFIFPFSVAFSSTRFRFVNSCCSCVASDFCLWLIISCLLLLLLLHLVAVGQQLAGEKVALPWKK